VFLARSCCSRLLCKGAIAIAEGSEREGEREGERERERELCREGGRGGRRTDRGHGKKQARKEGRGTARGARLSRHVHGARRATGGLLGVVT
jgi:hypothetical protein